MTAEVLTVTEVADLLGKSRRTVGRMVAAGDFPGAERTPQGWRIPADTLDAQTDPSDAASSVLTSSPAPSTADTEAEEWRSKWHSTADTVARITAELEEWRRRAEVAEAIAAERADALADARQSLALTQRLAALTIAENVTPIPQAVEQTTGTPSTIRRWLPRRWR